MRILRTSLGHLLVVAVSVLALACDDSPVAPGIEPQVINHENAFSYQVSDLASVTGSWDYTWLNTGTMAKVSHASDAGATGAATVTIRDAAGTQVYSEPFGTSGEAVTASSGLAGAWTITVSYSTYTNTQVNFAVIKQ